jgi:hypothetical protein
MQEISVILRTPTAIPYYDNNGDRYEIPAAGNLSGETGTAASTGWVEMPSPPTQRHPYRGITLVVSMPDPFTGTVVEPGGGYIFDPPTLDETTGRNQATSAAASLPVQSYWAAQAIQRMIQDWAYFYGYAQGW